MLQSEPLKASIAISVGTDVFDYSVQPDEEAFGLGVNLTTDFNQTCRTIDASAGEDGSSALLPDEWCSGPFAITDLLSSKYVFVDLVTKLGRQAK